MQQHRSPDSFVFGATVIHAAAGTPRYFQDIISATMSLRPWLKWRRQMLINSLCQATVSLGSSSNPPSRGRRSGVGINV